MPDQVAGHLVVSSSFQSLASPSNIDWVTGFQQEFGRDRMTGAAMESGWNLLHPWKQAVKRAGSAASTGNGRSI